MPVRVAYPGIIGSFSFGAARQVFPDAELIGYPTFSLAAEAVTQEKADYAMLPVENSFAGAVLATYGLLEELPLYIIGETLYPVRHQLLGVPGAAIEEIRQIASHPQAIAQCDTFLSGLPGVKVVASDNTAISAREVAERGDRTHAAIASAAAAEVFHLQILKADIQTSANNTTRFLIVSREKTPLSRPNKATVVFRVKNEVGALVRVLEIFADHGLNMIRIESRPLRNMPFLYFFTVDIDGEVDGDSFERAIKEARKASEAFRVIGRYAAGHMD